MWYYFYPCLINPIVQTSSTFASYSIKCDFTHLHICFDRKQDALSGNSNKAIPKNRTLPTIGLTVLTSRLSTY
jgi:hypothetical protein